MTDPDHFTGWFTAGGQEISGKCAGRRGPFNAENGDVLLQGHAYVVYEEWSNATNGCAMGLNSMQYLLSVAMRGAGYGAVQSSPYGIFCSLICSAAFAPNTPVTLTATPENGSVFSGWSGACTGAGSCTVTMAAAENVTATCGACTPAPSVQVTAAPAGPGRLRVSLSLTGSSISLEQVQFPATSNGLIDIGNVVGSPGGISVPLAQGTTSLSFIVRRAAPGAVTVPLTVVGSCGTWPTFGGGGADAF